MMYERGMYDRISTNECEQCKHAFLVHSEGEGWNIGKAMVYLVSDWTRYLTGLVWVVDRACTLHSMSRGRCDASAC
jgi:enoyl-[acyl-carrier-protein] reductase (NADH)